MTSQEVMIKRSSELYLIHKKGLSLSDCEDFVMTILADSKRIEE